MLSTFLGFYPTFSCQRQFLSERGLLIKILDKKENKMITRRNDMVMYDVDSYVNAESYESVANRTFFLMNPRP